MFHMAIHHPRRPKSYLNEHSEATILGFVSIPCLLAAWLFFPSQLLLYSRISGNLANYEYP